MSLQLTFRGKVPPDGTDGSVLYRGVLKGHEYIKSKV